MNKTFLIFSCLGLLACSAEDVSNESSDGGEPDTGSGADGAADVASDGCEVQDGACLPDSFGDCGAMQCDVALSAFTKNPGTIPYCYGSRTEAEVALSCPDDVSAGTCGDLFSLRYVYGFPGDNYLCAYDVTNGELVGAAWYPDSHPTQLAGKLPDASCVLDETPCGDGG